MKKIIASLAILFTALVPLTAQKLQSSFFLDNYSYTYKINPALQDGKAFFSLGTGNVLLSGSSNLGIDTFVFPSEGGLVTGLHPSISPEKFLGGLRDVNSVAADIDMNLLALGFRTGRMTHFLDLNLRSSESVSLPKSLFAFLKDGSSKNPYDLSRTRINSDSFLELAYGFRINLGSGYSFGARVKGLAGIMSAGSAISRADFIINENKIAYDLDAALRVAMPGLSITERGDYNYDYASAAPAGYGAAIDLGMAYSLWDDHLTLSASALDLGGISWKYNNKIVFKGEGSFEGLNAGDQENDILNRFIESGNMQVSNSETSHFQMLPSTLNLGVRYKIHGFSILSLGAFSTMQLSQYTGWYDVRAGATLTPFKWISVTANAGTSTFGPVVGGAASFKFLLARLFVGFDGYLGSVASMGSGSMAEQIPVPLSPFRMVGSVGLCLAI